MKILKRNYGVDPNWSMEVICNGNGWTQYNSPCFSKLEIDSEDIYLRKHTDLGGFTDTYYGFICPVCNCFTEISEDKMSTNIKNYAKEYNTK